MLAPQPDPLSSLLELAAERGAAKALEGIAARAPTRVTRETARAAGAPSWRWIEERGRLGLIILRGPRGGRYVLATELDALLASTTIKRRGIVAVVGGESIEGDATAAVAELVSRRAASR